ncbi:hypothetical protein BT092_09575 [Corynebacterium diphtheriae]|nr:hypothetical protein B1A57_10430 [Corynebacterium diphtheriae]PSA75125.1 hypothetical protein BT092_09575 [Corynebacterium diphtheriae]
MSFSWYVVLLKIQRRALGKYFSLVDRMPIQEQFNFTNLKECLAIKQWLSIGPIIQSLDPLVKRE